MTDNANVGNVQTLSRLLLYGEATSRRNLALRLGERDDGTLLQLLVDTVRSDDPWLLRARCLEVLGLAAGQGEPELAVEILCRLFEVR